MTGRHLSKRSPDFGKAMRRFTVYEAFYVISVAALFPRLHSSMLVLIVLLLELVTTFPPFVNLLEQTGATCFAQEGYVFTVMYSSGLFCCNTVCALL